MSQRSTTPADNDLNALRDELVLANHVLVRQGVLDAFGHVSARTGPGENAFLLARNLAPGSVTSDDLFVHDLDGNTSSDLPMYLERFIHAEIYRSRPDVMSVVHSHSPSVIPFSVSETPLRPVIHMAGFLSAESTPVYEMSDHAGDSTDLLITSSYLGRTLATTLAGHSVALMRGHGSVATGSSVREAVYRAVYTETNARVQIQALGLGSARYLSPGEAKAANETVGAQSDRAWNVWRSQILREGSEIR